MDGIFKFLDVESNHLDISIDEDIFTKSITLKESPALYTHVEEILHNNIVKSIKSDESDNDSVSTFNEEVKPIKKKVYINRTKLPFMQRLYMYCQDEKNREWIDFYPRGGVHIKDIQKLSEDSLISHLLKIKFTSFRKMLTNYGFQSIKGRSLVNEVIYQNSRFLKDSYEECLNILPIPEKLKTINHEKILRKRGMKRNSDTSSETSEEMWIPPRKYKKKEEKNEKTSIELPNLLSNILLKMKKIEEDFHSSSLSRSDSIKYREKLKVIQKLLEES
jgi:hypothetical protein